MLTQWKSRIRIWETDKFYIRLFPNPGVCLKLKDRDVVLDMARGRWSRKKAPGRWLKMSELRAQRKG